MTRQQIVRVAILSAVILVVVIALDYLINVVIAPGHTPYTPLTTAAIVLLVTPPAISYLMHQNAKVQSAQAALAEERVARLAADGANMAKTQFLANMSHELRTPLNAIIGYAELVEEETVAKGMEAAAEDCRRVHRAGRHLLGLINEILEHARLETGKFELQLAPTELLPLFSEVVEATREAASANGNTLEAECDADIGSAYLDGARLKQCMTHLASNAAKFTRGGAIILTLRGVHEDAFEFSVCDSGIGMNESTVSRLFQPFVQADTSVTRAYGGAGLGLAITKQLIESMGGAVHVVSERGVGSTFTITMRRGAPGSNVVTLAA